MNGGEVRVGPWQRGLDKADAAVAREMFARVRAADRRGPEAVPGPATSVLPARRGGELVGLAWRSGTDPAELVVDPAHRRAGIGAALAEQAWSAGGIWAHGTLPAAAALARSAGARAVRTMLQLRRDLTGPFLVELPDGVRVRSFVPGQDDEAFLLVNGRAFAWHPEQGRLDAAGLAAQMAEPWFDAEGFFLAVTDGPAGAAGSMGAAGSGGAAGASVGKSDAPAVVADTGETVLGFHWTKVHEADPTPPEGTAGAVGEVYVLGVDTDSPVRRLGTPLTLAGLAHLAGRGLSTVMLYVESDNEPALKLYRRLGFADYAVDTVFTRA